MTTETTRIGVLAGILALGALPGLGQLKPIHTRSVAPPTPTSPLRVVDSQDYSSDPVLLSLATLQTQADKQIGVAADKISQITTSAISVNDVNRVGQELCQHSVQSCNSPLPNNPEDALARVQAIASDIANVDQAAFSNALNNTGTVPVSITNLEVADLERLGKADARIRPQQTQAPAPIQRTPGQPHP